MKEAGENAHLRNLIQLVQRQLENLEEQNELLQGELRDFSTETVFTEL